MFVCVCVFVCLCVCLCVCLGAQGVSLHVPVHTSICTHVHMHTGTHIHRYIRTYDNDKTFTVSGQVWPLVPAMVYWSSPHDKQHYSIPPDGTPLQLSINGV